VTPAFGQAGRDPHTPELLRFQGDLRLENVSRDRVQLRENRQRGTSNVVEVGRLQNALDNALAPIQQLLYDELVVHGGLLEKSPNALAFNRILPRTTLLQSEGTPVESNASQNIAYGQNIGRHPFPDGYGLIMLC
jgi:hypothetical protein